MSKILDSCKVENDPEHIKNMTNYFLRNIPYDIWLKARVKSTKLNVPIRKVILSLIYLWLDNNYVDAEKRIVQQEFNF